MELGEKQSSQICCASHQNVDTYLRGVSHFNHHTLVKQFVQSYNQKLPSAVILLCLGHVFGLLFPAFVAAMLGGSC